MISKNEILSYVGKWCAPYTPFEPLESEEIRSEMEGLVKKMDSRDLPVLMDVVSLIKIDCESTFMEFAFFYVKEHKDEIADKILEYLKPEGPWQILELIGYTKKADLYPKMIERINYDLLDSNAKKSLFFAINLLRNEDAKEYLSEKLNIEIDAEIREEIEFALEVIGKNNI